MDNMKGVPYLGPTYIRRHSKKFSRPGHLAKRTVHPWYYFDVVWIKTIIIKIPHTNSDSILVLVEFLCTALHPEHPKSLTAQFQHLFL
jgi:hypothetical protein